MNNVDILFIIPPFHMRNGGGSFFPLGTGYIISSLEKRGYSWAIINCTEYIHSYYEEDLAKLEIILYEKLSSFSPLVVGIGPCVTTQLRALKKISLVCGKVFTNIPIFAGGPFTSIEGQEWVFNEVLGIKYLVKGDGEFAIPDVIQTIKESGDIRNSLCVSYGKNSKINVVKNLDVLEFPFRDFVKEDTYSIRRKSLSGRQTSMIASRGCPYSCSYCVSGNMKSNQVPFRRRSNDNIIQEMRKLKDEHGISDVVFYDDCFFSNRNKLSESIGEFCNMLLEAELGMQWQIEMRPDFFVLLSINELVLLREAGCRQINIGIEKISQNGLLFLGKNGSLEGLKEKISLAREKYEIQISATFILGGEEESEDDIKQLVDYAKELSLDFAHFNPLFVYPGTPLFNKVFLNKREWVDIVLMDKLPWGEIVYENENLDREQLLRLIDYAYKEFYKDTSLAHEQMIEDRFNIKRVEGEKGNADF